ncbi:hypothetical protein AB0M50_46100 [Nonomuraea fuscirosea]
MAARVTMAGRPEADAAADALSRTEQHIRERVPISTAVYLQPGSSRAGR